MRRTILILFVVALAALPVAAQEETPKAEVFGGYSWAGGNFHGWGASVTGNVNRWFGLTADFSGHHGSEQGGGVFERQRANSFLFGPRFSLRKKRATAFAYALAGGVNFKVKLSVPSAGVNLSASDTGFNMALGGGLDINVSKRVAVRAFQLDYMRPTFFGDSHHRGRLAVGLVLRLGKK